RVIGKSAWRPAPRTTSRSRSIPSNFCRCCGSGCIVEVGMPHEAPVNVLLVDDKTENLLALESVLDAPDYHLVRALSGQDALLALLEREYAAIVLDVQMPGM